MSEVKPWPLQGPMRVEQPRRIKRPCDWGLWTAVNQLEVQLGTIEAFNRLVDAADELKARIDVGDVKAQNPLYAIDIRGGTELK